MHIIPTTNQESCVSLVKKTLQWLIWKWNWLNSLKTNFYNIQSTSYNTNIQSWLPWWSSIWEIVGICDWGEHERTMRKNYGFTPNLDFNPLPIKFNFTKFLPTSMHSESIQHIKGEENKYKHGMSIVFKLVSIDIRKGMHFWQLCS